MNKIKLIIPFILIEIIFLTMILTILGPANRYISFACILFTFLYSLLFTSKENKKYLINIGLLFTVFSDISLVLIRPMNQSTGMTTFLITQICYFLYLYFNTDNSKSKNIHLITRITLNLLTIIITIIVLKKKTDYLSIISMLYYINLIINVIVAFTKTKKSILLPLGLLLFLCCDTLIGIREAAGVYLNISETSLLYKMAYSSFNFPWVFYIPSQVIITLSLTENHKLKLTK